MITRKDKWLIGVDLDGTLLKTPSEENRQNFDYEIEKKNLDIIKKVIDQGHKVAIITGRPWEDSKPIYEYLGLESIIANFNGAHIHYPNNEAFIPVTYSINRDIMIDMFNEDILKKAGIAFIVETLDKTYVRSDSNKHISGRLHSIGMKNRVVFDKIEEIDVNPQAILIGLDYENVDPYEVLQTLRRKYDDAMFFRLWDARDRGWMILEINQKAANKGTALGTIASYYNIPLSNTMSFGDGLNDREMLIAASHGVAMKNAKGTIKTYANDVTDLTNDEGGVGDYIAKFFNIK